MPAWLSRYRPRYVRSLVYMLQATEYNTNDYLGWYRRTSDFGHVEIRHRLKKTPKALALLAACWLIVAVLIGLMTAFALRTTPPLRFIVPIVGLLLVPYLTAYLVLLPLFIVRLAEIPVVHARMRRARRTLAAHPGVKIAVAGSYGKTTMREILRAVLAEGKAVAAPPHSFNTPLGISGFVRGLTGREQVLIFELGEYYPGDIRRLCELVDPDMGVITGINEAHLSRFKKLERTTATIFELADWLGNKPLYVNGESELARHRVQQHLEYTRAGVAGWHVSRAETSLGGTTFALTKGSTKMHIKSHLLGLHQIGPLAAAAAIAAELGCTADQIERGLGSVQPFEHRLQPSTDAAGITIIDDSYNGNPDGVRACIDFLATLKGRRFYVTPGLVEMGPSSRAVHEAIGHQLAAEGIEQVVLVRNSVTPHIAEGLGAAHYKGHITWYDTGPAALAALPQLTVRGDIVLLQNDWPDQYA